MNGTRNRTIACPHLLGPRLLGCLHCLYLVLAFFFRVEGIPHHRAIAGVSDSAFDYLGLRSFQMPLSRTDTLININLTITCTIRMNFN